MERKKVPYSIPVYINYAQLEEAIDDIRAAEQKLKEKGATDIYFNADIVYDSPELTVVGQIPESDEQMNLRLAQEARWEEQERARYEKLKEKFGDN